MVGCAPWCLFNSPAQRARGVLRSPVTGKQYFYFARAGRPLGVPGRKVPRDGPARDGFPPGRGFQAPQSAPRALQDAPKMAPSRPPIGPRRPRWPPHGPRRLLDAPRGLQETSQERPQGQQIMDFHWFLKDFGVLAFSAYWRSKTAQEAPKIPPTRPNRPPRGPQNGPGGPQDSPRGLQDCPRGPQDGSKSGPRRGTGTDISRSRPQEMPRRPQEAPKRPPRGPKRPPRGPREASGGH